MNNNFRFIVRFLLVSTALVAISTQFTQATPPDGWHAVDPGFPLQVLLGRGSAMWAAGSGESIAVSIDAGQHWQRKHQDPKGALLLVLNFVDDKFGYAAGTGGKVLFTQDGGETWTVKKLADETILQAAFSDAQHGVIRTISALNSTTDGGKIWRAILPSDHPVLKLFPFTYSMVALDRGQIIIRVSDASPTNGNFLWTSDGGVTWNICGIGGQNDTRIYDLYVKDRDIYTAGFEEVKTEAYYSSNSDSHARQQNYSTMPQIVNTPMSFRFIKGATWEHIPVNWDACRWPGCGGYTAQGYLAGKDSIVLTGNGKEQFLRFPIRETISGQWAVSGSTLCMHSGTSVECTEMQSMQKVQVNSGMPAWESHDIPRVGSTPLAPHCVFCELKPDYYTKNAAIGPVDVQIALVVAPSGEVSGATIISDLPDDVAPLIQHQVQTWIFEPFLKNGEPAEVKLELKTHLTVLKQGSLKVVRLKQQLPMQQ